MELIVVLAIFAVLSAVTFYNYGAFQANIDVKNLASDIALQIVQAQKASLNGVLPTPGTYDPTTWKPSYGVYVNAAANSITYFTDLNGGGYSATGDIYVPMTITKGKISSVDRCSSTPCISVSSISPLSISFQRPNSDAIFYSGYSLLVLSPGEYIQITVTLQNKNAYIKIYPSGRIEIN